MTTKQGDPITANLNQLIVITGARGVGKSTAAATFLPPANIDKMVAIDNENSLNNFRAGLNALGKDFGLYINTMARFGNLPGSADLLTRMDKGEVPWVGKAEQGMFINYFEYFRKEISQIPPHKYKTLIIDTGERLEAGIAAYVEANKKKFGVTDTSYGKLWVNGVYPLYSHIFQGIWDLGIQTIIINFHLKNVWEGKRPIPGKVTHAGKKLLYYLSSMMVWLVNDGRNPNGEPAGLILKERLGRVGISADGDEWDIKTMLPQRVPCFTWKNVAQYMRDGYDITHPKETEVRSNYENEMISELITDKQMQLMLNDVEVEKQENAIALAEAGIIPTVQEETVTIGGNDESSGPKTKAEAITRWKSVGRPLPELLRKFRERGVTDENLAEHWESMVTGQEE